MSAHARLEAYGLVQAFGQRLAADPAVRAALRGLLDARARLDAAIADAASDLSVVVSNYTEAEAEAAAKLRACTTPYAPDGLCVEVFGGLGMPQLIVFYAPYPGCSEDPGWDLDAEALARGDVVLLPAPDGSGEVVGI